VSRKMPVTLDLEPEMNQAIGALAVKFSFLEWLVDHLVYDLIGTKTKPGRIAVSAGQTFEDRIAAAKRLLEVEEPGFHPTGRQLLNRIKRLQKFRNQLLHGIWVQDRETGKFALQLVRGQGRSRSRVIDPEKTVLEPDDIRHETRMIQDLTSELAELRINIWADRHRRDPKRYPRPRPPDFAFSRRTQVPRRVAKPGASPRVLVSAPPYEATSLPAELADELSETGSASTEPTPIDGSGNESQSNS